MADDAGALLVRSGLVSSNALDDARARVASIGGTLGEQLVTNGAIGDDDLTDFYRSRLLVPQVNPNLLARLTPKVVATIPSDMAIELRAIPVSLDGDNNLTVAMSDPSDRHAVDEIAFFTGAYVVRAVATQMQIAWCLAHYYGHVTALGQRLLFASPTAAPAKPAITSASQQPPRTKDVPGNAPESAPTHAPASTPLPASTSPPASAVHPASPLPTPPTPTSTPAAAPRVTSSTSTPAVAPRITPSTSTPAAAPRITPSTSTPTVAPRATPASSPVAEPRTTPASTPVAALLPTGAGTPVPLTSTSLDEPTPLTIEISDDATPTDDELPRRMDNSPDPTDANDGSPDRSRARSVSGEIRMPVRRAASIRPPMPEPEPDDDDEPLIVIEQGEPEDVAARARTLPPRRRAVKSDPPELYARAGEVDLKTDSDRSIDVDEPRIVVDEDALVTPTSLMAMRAARGEATTPPSTTIDVLDDADTGALIHDRIVDNESQPILLERPRATPEQFRSAAPVAAAPAPGRADDDDTITGETNIVVLEAKKPRGRPERRTQVGIPPAPIPVPVARPHRDTEATGIPTMLEHVEADRTQLVDEDATTLDNQPVPRNHETTSDRIGAPPSSAGYNESHPQLIAPPPRPAPPRSSVIQQAVIIEEDEAEGDEPRDPRTTVMSAVELENAIPQRTAEVAPEPLSRHRIKYDPIDDGWGPPGTTIPPPLLGAIPGSDDDDGAPSAIPMPDVDSLPLIVGPPLPSSVDSGARALVRALEEATARAIEVIRQLERADSRDAVVGVMVAHLTETHHRAGFFVTRHGISKDVTELSLFSMAPKPAVMPFATLRLDRPSTLQDVVGTRLPYRGPMHDEASRTFLISILGACPAEILLVPVAVRERVVGVLFGEHRQRHTFDDQLALAARAAGMALERILKSKRG